MDEERVGRSGGGAGPWLWGAVATLALIGVAAGLGRVASLATGGASYEPVRRMLPAAWLEDTLAFDGWFAGYPVLTLMHVLPGAVFLALAPFQFSARLRARRPALHRRLGRVAALCALTAGASALVLGAVFPYNGPAASAAVFTFGALFLYTLARALAAIRRGDAARHREWMIRAFAVGAGISTIRIVSVVLLAATGARPLEVAGASFWTGFVLTFAAGEAWVRLTRPRSPDSSTETNMKKTFAALVFALCLCCGPAAAQDAPKTKEVKQYVYVLRLVPRLLEEKNWTKQDGEIVGRHFRRLQQLHREGKVVLAGRTLNESEPSQFGVVVLEVKTEEEARRIMEEDDAVKEKIMTAQLFPFSVALIKGSQQ